MAENSDNTLHFSQYFRVIRNRMWVIFTIFLLTVISGTYVTEEVLPKGYTASAQMQLIPRGQVESKGFIENNTHAQFDQVDFQAEFEIMQSPDVLMPIIKELNLDQIWAKRVFKSNLDRLSAIDAVAYMNTVLNIDFRRGTNIIVVTASSEIPEEAAAIANALVNRYKSMREIEDQEKTNKGSDVLRDKITQQQKVVDDQKAALEKLRLAMPVAIVAGSASNLTNVDQELDTRKRDLAAAKLEAQDRAVMLSSVEDLPDDQYINTLEALGRAEGPITQLRSEILQQEGDMDNLVKQGFEENHPRVQAIRAEHDREVAQLKDLIAGSRRALVVEAQIAASRVTVLEKEVNDLLEQTTKDQSGYLVPFRDAEQELERQQSILDAYTIRLDQMEADNPLKETPVKIISLAEVPERPSSPKVTLNIAVSVVAGLFLGVVVAFLIEYLDTSVKTMADAEQLLGLPVLTIIPNKGGPMPLTQAAARLPHAEGYRILRAKLDLKVQNGVGPSLSMLSGGPGEGKSTTIYNLAVVCAQAGQSVILVDCDLRRPTVHDLVKISNDRGVANYLRGEGDAVEYIQQTAIPTLHALPAGEMPFAEIGTLAGDKIRHMLEDLKQRYDLVLVDSPPVLGISDGSIIAREVDYVILVIQHRRYPREISLRAKRAIEEVHGNCVGMVLNAVAIKSDDSYYYYSNYGNYYKNVGKKKKQRPTKPGKPGAEEKTEPALASNRHKELDSEEF